MKVIWSRLARERVNEIADYIAEDDTVISENDLSDVRAFDLGDDSAEIRKALKSPHYAEDLNQKQSRGLGNEELSSRGAWRSST